MRYCQLLLLLALLALLSPNLSSAQGTPQYMRRQSHVAIPNAWFYYGDNTTDTPVRGRRLQFIYPDSEFLPRTVRGYMKNIYFWARGAKTFNTISTLYNVEIKMGYTQRDSFKYNLSTTYGVRDTFITGLTTVFKADSVTEDLLTQWAYWWKFPLMGNGFYYNASLEQNLVVEFAFGLPVPKGWVVLADSGGGGTLRCLSGFRDSIAVEHWPGATGILTGSGGSAQFGFDLVPGPPNAVPASASASDIQIYPNPTKGSFRLLAAFKEAPQNLHVTVRDMEGRPVWQKQIKTTSTRVSEDIDIGGAAPGTYFVELQSGNTKWSRPLTLQ